MRYLIVINFQPTVRFTDQYTKYMSEEDSGKNEAELTGKTEFRMAKVLAVGEADKARF